MNKISVGNINQIIKNSNSSAVILELTAKDKIYTIAFKRYLSIEEESKFISRVIGCSFDQISDEYLPQYSELGKWIAVLQFMTNIEIPIINNTTNIDIEKCKSFINASCIKDKIDSWGKLPIDNERHLVYAYIYRLFSLVDDKINYIKEQNAHKSKLDELFDTVKDEVKKYSSKFDNVDMKQFTEDLHKISGMVGKVDTKTILDEIIKVNQKTNSKDKIVNIADVKQ